MHKGKTKDRIDYDVTVLPYLNFMTSIVDC